MRFLSKVGVWVAVIVAGLGCQDQGNPDAPAGAASSDDVERVILLIADGTGAAYYTAAKWSKGALAVGSMAVAGLTDVRSSDAWITDSAASATTYATGHRTYNGAIGVGDGCRDLMAADSVGMMADPASCDPLEGVFDIAERVGLARGLVSTSSVTHATPASFGAKVPHRRMQSEIASQYAEGSIDVLLGGGTGWFDGSLRADGRDILTTLCAEADCPTTAAELAARAPSERRLVGLFAPDGMVPMVEGREPGLPAMTRAALEQLSLRSAGFFLMVEGSQPDWEGHDNASLDRVVAEVVEFDDAVQVALDFQARTPGTLVVVVSDHETGGLSLLTEGGQVVAGYTTGGHTGEMTPHFAHGPGAARFSGIMENHEIGAVLMEIMRNREEWMAINRD